MMKRSWVAAALTAGMLAGTVACGSDEGSGSDSNELTVWIMDGTNVNQEQFFDDVEQDFADDHPGWTVEVQYVPWTAAHDKFNTALGGGTGPDVAEMGTTWTPEFADAQGLRDITEELESSGLADSMTALESTEFDGANYGVPWYAGIRSIVYRADWFDELDLDPPETWDDLMAAGTTLQSEMPDVHPFPVAGDYLFALLPFIWGAGGDIAVEEDDAWRATIAEPEAVEGIEFFTGLHTEHGFSPQGAVNWTSVEVVQNFGLGNLAMAPAGEWEIATILDEHPDLDGKLGTVEFPTPDEGQPSESFLGGSNLVVMETSDQTEAAWDYIELLSSEKWQLQWAEDTRYFPTVEEVADQPDWAEAPEMQAFLEQYSTGRSVPTDPNWGAVEGDKVLQTMVQSILGGDASVEEAAATAAEEMDSMLGG